MNVIGHHNRHAQIEFDSVVMQAASQHDRPRCSRQYPSPVSAESDKMLPVIHLKMRQLPTIKSLRHRLRGKSTKLKSCDKAKAYAGLKVYVGTAAPGCPRSAAPRFRFYRHSA